MTREPSQREASATCYWAAEGAEKAGRGKPERCAHANVQTRASCRTARWHEVTNSAGSHTLQSLSTSSSRHAMASATQAAAVLPEPVQCAAVYPQGWILACAAHNSSEVQIWHSSTQGQDWCFVTALQGHSGAVSGLDFNADGLLASCSYDRTTCIWRPSSNPRCAWPRFHLAAALAASLLARI